MENTNFVSKWSENKILIGLLAVVFVGVIVWLGTAAANNLKKYQFIGKPEQRDSIYVRGEGKIIAVPDIALINVGVFTEKPTVQAAQQENTTKMNKLIASLKELGVEAKDIQTTEYNISPRYDYTEGKRVMRGYEVSQNVGVKVRNLDKIDKILAKAGAEGANQIRGLQFDIDEPEKLRQEARILALTNAKEKAIALANATGIKLGKIITFSEEFAEPLPMYRSEMMALGAGGGAEMAAPTIEKGSLEIKAVMAVSYEIGY